MNSNIKNTKGFTLIEVLVYLAVLAMIFGLIGFVLVKVYGVSGDISGSFQTDRYGITVIDRIAREIYAGTTIDIDQSVFRSNEGVLVINDMSEETPIVKSFELSDGRVIYTEDGVVAYSTPEDIVVSRLFFTPVMAASSTAVKYDVDITWEKRGIVHTTTYTGLSRSTHIYE